MAFTSYEELMQAVEERRADRLVLSIDMGSPYSVEYEEAKEELKRAQALKTLSGGQGFLNDNLAELEAKVAELKPEPNLVWVAFSRLRLGEWAALVKNAGSSSPVEQYERVLPKTFLGVYGSDDLEAEPLSRDFRLLSSKGEQGIFPGGALHQIVQAFISWQNSGGDVTISPTKSGRA